MPELLEILDWVFLIAALVILVLQFQVTNLNSYRSLNVVFWLLMAGCFVINGLDSVSFWQWIWYAAAVASVVAAFAVPTPRRFITDQDV